ncbi:MAG: lincosamide nucleotidyltransferase [Gaiellaceae bacterium]|nr:lincosamide nucleotidyltransferase [Gaiellaceae bacterium]
MSEPEKPRAGRDREPQKDMAPADVLVLLDRLERQGFSIWLDGGWGVDALLEEQTRPHDDLDIVVPLDEVPRLQQELEQHGFRLAGGEAPLSFEMVDVEGRQIDIHPVVFNDEGEGIYRMNNGRSWRYPAAGFAGSGAIAGRKVR